MPSSVEAVSDFRLQMPAAAACARNVGYFDLKGALEAAQPCACRMQSTRTCAAGASSPPPSPHQGCPHNSDKTTGSGRDATGTCESTRLLCPHTMINCRMQSVQSTYRRDVGSHGAAQRKSGSHCTGHAQQLPPAQRLHPVPGIRHVSDACFDGGCNHRCRYRACQRYCHR